MRTGVIYCIENKVNGKKYVGRTINFKKRKKQHLANYDNSVIGRAIQKYGKEKFVFKIIENNIKLDKLDEKEIMYIKKMTNKKDYNCSPGGDGQKSCFNNPNIKLNERKIFSILKDRKKGMEYKQLKEKYGLSRAVIGRICSGEHNILNNLNLSNIDYDFDNHRRKYGNYVNKDLALKILEEKAKKNLTYRQLCNKYNISCTVISKIINNKHPISNKIDFDYNKINKKETRNPLSDKEGKTIFYKYYFEGFSDKKLSNEYNIDRSVISNIINCNHPTTKNMEIFKREKFNHRSNLTKEDGLEIFIKYHNGNWTQTELAEEYNTSQSVVGKITRSEHWTTKHLAEGK